MCIEVGQRVGGTGWLNSETPDLAVLRQKDTKADLARLILRKSDTKNKRQVVIVRCPGGQRVDSMWSGPHDYQEVLRW